MEMEQPDSFPELGLAAPGALRVRSSAPGGSTSAERGCSTFAAVSICWVRQSKGISVHASHKT